MSSSRLELKVGLFVIVLLGLAAVMSIKFSKSGFGRGPTYSIKLKTEDAGTIIKNAPVLMSGVKVGYVDEIDLDLHGSVTLTVKLFSKYADNIDANATFKIKSSGFLGDQFIGVFPPPKRTEPLMDGAQQIPCESPFDIMSVGRDAQKLILSVGERVEELNATIVKVNEGLLSEKTLQDFTESIGIISRKIKALEELNATKISTDLTQGIAKFSSTMEDLNNLSSGLDINATKISQDVTQGIAKFSSTMEDLHSLSSGLDDFNATIVSQDVADAVKNIKKTSLQLRDFTADLNSSFADNRTTITNMIGNISVVTEKLISITENSDKIAERLEAGKGLAGTLLKDEKVQLQFKEILGDLRKTVENIKILTKNLKEHGLLHKPKVPHTTIPGKRPNK